MSYSGNQGGGEPMAAMNVVPLVDVMLVLLIIFMVTAPLMAHKVEVELPRADLEERPDTAPPAPPITIAVKDNGDIFLNDQPVTHELPESALSVGAHSPPYPPCHDRGAGSPPSRAITAALTLT